jgi:urease accessory protein
MKHAREVRPAGEWDKAKAADHVALEAVDRYRRRFAMKSARGMMFLLDLPVAVALKAGDGLVLDDGSTVLVTAIPEDLAEIMPRDATDAVRLAWHLGNRHTEVQFVAGNIRIRRDHVLEAMVTQLGATVTHVIAPFDPEPGAHNHVEAADGA